MCKVCDRGCVLEVSILLESETGSLTLVVSSSNREQRRLHAWQCKNLQKYVIVETGQTRLNVYVKRVFEFLNEVLRLEVLN